MPPSGRLISKRSYMRAVIHVSPPEMKRARPFFVMVVHTVLHKRLETFEGSFKTELDALRHARSVTGEQNIKVVFETF